MILGNVRGGDGWKQSRATNLLESDAKQMQLSRSDAALKSKQHFISSTNPIGDQIGAFDAGLSQEQN